MYWQKLDRNGTILEKGNIGFKNSLKIQQKNQTFSPIGLPSIP